MLPEVQYPFQYQPTGTGVSVGWYWAFNSINFQEEYIEYHRETTIPYASSYRDAARHVSTEVSRHLRKSQFVDLTVHITTKRGLNIPLKPRRYNLLPLTYREFCSNHVPFYTFSINSKT